MKSKHKALPIEELRYTCPEKSIPWKSTAKTPVLEGPVGQERALAAIEFGLKIDNTGYNLFLLGEPGSGKSSTIMAMVKEKCGEMPVPQDWAYVHNFRNSKKPLSIPFPPGKGKLFVRQMSELIEVLKKSIPAALEDKDFEARRNEVLESLARENAELLELFQNQAREVNYSFEKVKEEFIFIALLDGEKLSEEQFRALPEETQKEYENAVKALREQLKEVSRNARKREEETRLWVDAMTKEQVKATVEPLIETLYSEHTGNEKLVSYLNLLLEDILDNFTDFIESHTESPVPAGMSMITGEKSFERYGVNLIVDMSSEKCAPVVYERHPAFYNLIGKMEYSVQFGMATTGFSQIQPGALHLANGGYLVLDALEVLRSPFAWEALKNSLKAGLVQIEDLGEQYRMITTSAIRPEPIPIDLKVILMGTPMIYYLLLHHDEDFTKMFKVKADFGSTMERTDSTIKDYALFAASQCKTENLLPFDADAIAAVVEHGARKADDKNRLTTHFNEIANIMSEASFWAREEGSDIVTRKHVTRAEEKRKHRHNRIEERMGDLIEEGSIMVQTEGETLGQVNGLSVYDMGDYRFAKPTRITAKVFLGKAGMVNVEREVKLSGSIHSKGVMIVSSYLSMRYAHDFPLSLSASITFEQTYSEVDGDSASAAEFICLASAIAGIPVRQDIAITGSMDQHGNIQPIGGVNEKIEGFFETCRARGLKGSEGVVIPKTNVRNLMLSSEVVDAVSRGEFAIYAIEKVDVGIEILTGTKAGERGKAGTFPKGSFNRTVEDRLREMAEKLKAHEEEAPEEEEDE
jgi:lon-related putative ATP-dependent protease